MNGWHAIRMSLVAVAAAVVLFSAVAGSSSAKADIFSFDSGWGGAGGGALLGGIIGGGEGAAAGALIGGLVGTARGGSKKKKRRRQAEQYRAQERARWEQQQRVQQQQLELQRQQAWQQQQQQLQQQQQQQQGAAQATLITEIQRALIRLGYDPGGVDGQTGAQTTEAIRAYERDKRLLETGQSSQPLLTHMLQSGG